MNRSLKGYFFLDYHCIFLVAFLSLGFIGDLLIALFPHLLGINLILRGVGSLPIIYITLSNSKNLKVYLFFVIGVCVFILNYLLYSVFFPHDKGESVYFVSTLVWSIKNFGFIIFILYYLHSDRAKSKTDTILKILIFFFVLYLVFQLGGAILKVELFKTYGVHAFRSGYKGIVFAVNEATVFYFFGGLLLILYSLDKSFVFRYFAFLLSISSLFVLGTKAGWGLLLVQVFYFSFLNFGGKRSLKIAFVFLLLFSGAVLYLYHTNLVFSDIVDLSIGYYKYRFENQEGFIFILTSGRNVLVESSFSWAIYNMPTSFLFGGMPVSYKFIEMDMFDQILVFGIGYVLLYYLVIAYFLGGVNSKLVYLSFFIVALFAGHAVDSIVAAPFVAGSFVYISNR